MRRWMRVALFPCFGAGVALLACAHEPNNEVAQPEAAVGAPTNITAASPSNRAITNDVAEDQFATASCDHESMCQHIGKDRAFTTRDRCSDAMRAKASVAIGPADCPSGIDNRALRACVDRVSAATCDEVNTSPFTDPACSPSSLCIGYH